jgi:hypothetical protein
LFLLPPVFYDLAYNVNHNKPGSFVQSLMAVVCALAAAFLLSLMYWLTGFVDKMPYFECLVMGLSLATVDTDQTSIDTAKTMSLAVNSVMLLLVQFLTVEVDLTFTETLAMVII